MGFNCKNVQKIENKLANANNTQNDKKGVWNIFNKFTVLIQEILIKIGVVLLVFILTPIVVVVLIYNYIFKNSAYFPINTNIVKNIAKLDS